MRISKDLVERLVTNYLDGQLDGLNYIEVRGTDSLGNTLTEDGPGWLELVIDHDDYFSRDILVDGGATSMVEFVDRQQRLDV